MFYIIIIENKMESIFQNLPNNLIMNIIKMETDRKNEEIRLGLIESKNKFKDCVNQMRYIEGIIDDQYVEGQHERDYYLSDARANYESENGGLYYGFFLSDLFSEIEDSNNIQFMVLEDSDTDDDDNNMVGGQIFSDSDDE